MPEIITLTDADFQAVIDSPKPILVVLTNDSGIRGDFSTAFKKASDDHQDIVFAEIDVDNNPIAREHFKFGKKSVLVAVHRGEELVRRSRPWGTDVPLAIELLQNAIKNEETDDQLTDEKEELAPKTQEETPIMSDTPANIDTKPINVTDDTFEELVLNSPLPVLVDYWAEWCGPCRMVAPVLEKLAEEYAGKVRIAKVDVDSNQGLAQHFKVMSIPTIQMIKDRTIVFSQPGALPEPAFRDLIEQLIALEIPQEGEEATETTEEASEEPINES